MEGQRKKRKVEYEEEDEEKKIEQFFALIKSTRQVCHLLRGSSKWSKKKQRDQNTKEVDQEKAAGGSVWNPTFQPEDFLDQDDKGTTAGHGASPSTVQEENEEDKGGIGLDLKLSL